MQSRDSYFDITGGFLDEQANRESNIGSSRNSDCVRRNGRRGYTRSGRSRWNILGRRDVNGLSGTGLVLQNNGSDDLSVSSQAATFTFATGIADRATYSVIVKTQPTGQTCTVNNGTGTTSGANITNVSVTCSVNSYAVGGTVSGLTGSGSGPSEQRC